MLESFTLEESNDEDDSVSVPSSHFPSVSIDDLVNNLKDQEDQETESKAPIEDQAEL